MVRTRPDVEIPFLFSDEITHARPCPSNGNRAFVNVAFARGDRQWFAPLAAFERAAEPDLVAARRFGEKRKIGWFFIPGTGALVPVNARSKTHISDIAHAVRRYGSSRKITIRALACQRCGMGHPFNLDTAVEKNQLGLGQMLLNGLRFTWAMSLLADAAVILRARSLLERPTPRSLLAELMPTQLSLGLPMEASTMFSLDAHQNSTFWLSQHSLISFPGFFKSSAVNTGYSKAVSRS